MPSASSWPRRARRGARRGGSGRDRGREHAGRARRRGRRCATASTSSTCSPGSTIVDPQTTWIEPDVALEPDAAIHPFTVLRGTTRSPRGRRSARTRSRSTPRSGPGATVGPFCYLRPVTVLGRRRRPGTFVEIKNSPSGRTRRCRTSRTSATPRSERGRTRRRIDHRELSASAGSAEGPDDDRPQRQVAVDTMFVAPVVVGDDAWIAAGSVITDDVPEARSPASHPTGQQGRARWKAGRLSRHCPGSRARAGRRRSSWSVAPCR